MKNLKKKEGGVSKIYRWGASDVRCGVSSITSSLLSPPSSPVYVDTLNLSRRFVAPDDPSKAIFQRVGCNLRVFTDWDEGGKYSRIKKKKNVRVFTFVQLNTFRRKQMIQKHIYKEMYCWLNTQNNNLILPVQVWKWNFPGNFCPQKYVW